LLSFALSDVTSTFSPTPDCHLVILFLPYLAMPQFHRLLSLLFPIQLQYRLLSLRHYHSPSSQPPRRCHLLQLPRQRC
jgi:hypothetical protein